MPREDNAEANGLAQAALRRRAVQEKIAKQLLLDAETVVDSREVISNVSTAELLA